MIYTASADTCIASLARATAAGIPDVIREHGDEIRCADGSTVGIGQARGSMGSTLPGCYVLTAWYDSGPIAAWDLDARGLVRRPSPDA